MLTAPQILDRLPLRKDIGRAARRRRVHLVGGAVRNAFLGLATTDYDFLVADAVEVARRLAAMVKGTLVVLHEDLPTARVVVRHGNSHLDLDFVTPRSATVSADLRMRDFTINAMAAGPLGRSPRLLDPCGGRGDLARREVRMTSARALAADPLRVLRAYRFAAELGFRIDAATRSECRGLAAHIDTCAAERVGAEVVSLCAGAHVAGALRAMEVDGILVTVMPEIGRMVGVHQGGVHEFDVAEHSLLAVRRLMNVVDEIDILFPAHADAIREYLRDRQNRAGLVLGTLLHDVGKPECRVRADGRWRFFGHEARGAQIATWVGERLRLSRSLRRQIELLVGSHMRLLPFMGTDEPTDRARRRFIRDNQEHTIGLVLLALADRRALGCDPQMGDEDEVLTRLRRLFAVAREAEAEPEGTLAPVTGDDLIDMGLEPGPLFSEILKAVENEWVAGRISDRDEALRWVRERYT